MIHWLLHRFRWRSGFRRIIRTIRHRWSGRVPGTGSQFTVALPPVQSRWPHHSNESRVSTRINKVVSRINGIFVFRSRAVSRRFSMNAARRLRLDSVDVTCQWWTCTEYMRLPAEHKNLWFVKATLRLGRPPLIIARSSCSNSHNFSWNYPRDVHWISIESHVIHGNIQIKFLYYNSYTSR